jgi:hypothetical protein
VFINLLFDNFCLKLAQYLRAYFLQYGAGCPGENRTIITAKAMPKSPQLPERQG